MAAIRNSLDADPRSSEGDSKVSKMSSAVLYARSEAILEASEHLMQDWTEETEERNQGNLISAKLRLEADKWLHLANRRKKEEFHNLRRLDRAEKTA